MIKIKLIDNYKTCWKLYSVQVFVALAFLPEIYAGLASLGWFDTAPDGLVWCLRVLAGVGLISRVIKQEKKESK